MMVIFLQSALELFRLHYGIVFFGLRVFEETQLVTFFLVSG